MVENGRQQGAHGATVGAADNSLEVEGETETNIEHRETENRNTGEQEIAELEKGREVEKEGGGRKD